MHLDLLKKNPSKVLTQFFFIYRYLLQKMFRFTPAFCSTFNFIWKLEQHHSSCSFRSQPTGPQMRQATGRKGRRGGNITSRTSVEILWQLGMSQFCVGLHDFRIRNVLKLCVSGTGADPDQGRIRIRGRSRELRWRGGGVPLPSPLELPVNLSVNSNKLFKERKTEQIDTDPHPPPPKKKS